MGVDYSATLVLGVDVTGKMRVEGERPSCRHSNPPHAKFCQECGTSVRMIKESHWIEAYEDLEEMVIQESMYGDGKMFVGRSWEVGRGGDCKSVHLPDTAAYREELRAKLEPHGLWDPEKFGLFLMMQAY